MLVNQLVDFFKQPEGYKELPEQPKKTADK